MSTNCVNNILVTCHFAENCFNYDERYLISDLLIMQVKCVSQRFEFLHCMYLTFLKDGLMMVRKDRNM
jgi:hypothetical protein